MEQRINGVVQDNRIPDTENFRILEQIANELSSNLREKSNLCLYINEQILRKLMEINTICTIFRRVLETLLTINPLERYKNLLKSILGILRNKNKLSQEKMTEMIQEQKENWDQIEILQQYFSQDNQALQQYLDEQMSSRANNFRDALHSHPDTNLLDPV